MSYSEPCSAIANKQEVFPSRRRKADLFGPLCCSRSGCQFSQGVYVGDLGQSYGCCEVMKGLLTQYQKVHVPAKKHASQCLLWPRASVDPNLLIFGLMSVS